MSVKSQLQESEKKLNRSLQEVKKVEFELEEATSQKKVGMVKHIVQLNCFFASFSVVDC